MPFVFKYITEKLLSARSSLLHCLDNKDWASTGSEYHIAIRKRYAQEVEEIDRILKFIKYKPKGETK